MQQFRTITQSYMNQPEILPEMPSPYEPIVGGKNNKQKEGWRSVLSTIFIIIATPIMALLLITFVFQSYEVDGPSMETTLQNADRLIVWKAPKTWSSITGNDYIPDRGEIIIFHKNSSLEGGLSGGDRQLIKRVVGVPGDRVVVKDNIVTVYNDDNPTGFNPDEVSGNKSERSKITEGEVDYTVNEGEVFVLGDNRGNSQDSRFFGAVSSDDIVGNLSFRIYPFNKFQKF
jgi:signal peptidase I